MKRWIAAVCCIVVLFPAVVLAVEMRKAQRGDRSGHHHPVSPSWGEEDGQHGVLRHPVDRGPFVYCPHLTVEFLPASTTSIRPALAPTYVAVPCSSPVDLGSRSFAEKGSPPFSRPWFSAPSHLVLSVLRF
ncbi:MAG TPA: hypothetical protein VNN77_18885 [candidate division Zixibacteria bacterium]|nr:hypothetical protein [candidate division Zixibacteria bacterium]